MMGIVGLYVLSLGSFMMAAATLLAADIRGNQRVVTVTIWIATANVAAVLGVWLARFL